MQKKYLITFVISSILILFIPTSAQAMEMGGAFGKREGIKCIQPIKDRGYSLCHKYSQYFFIAGVSLSDDGYVLASGDDATSYQPLDKEKILELQNAGYLPNPLPSYSIPLTQYLIGYSLWLLLIFGIGGFPLWSYLQNRYKKYSLRGRYKMWKHKGKYCLNCDNPLMDYDFKIGRCVMCSSAVPEIRS